MTIYLLAITCIISFAAFQNEKLLEKFVFNPYKVHYNNEWYRLLTSGFIHADWMHLLINMFVLYSFGTAVEQYYGVFFYNKATVYFLLLYFGGIFVSILPTYIKQRENPNYNALGASGAISAVLFSFILIQPLQKICLYGILCFPGIILGGIYLVYSYFAGKKSSDNINHDAHFWGAVYGIGLTLALEPKLGTFFIDQLLGTNILDSIL